MRNRQTGRSWRPVATLLASGALLFCSALVAQAPRPEEVQLRAAQHKEEVEGDLRGAIAEYAKLAQSRDRAVAAKALVRMADCYQKLGDGQSRAIYERVAREFADQKGAAAEARTRLASLRNLPLASVGIVTRQIWIGVANLYATSPSGDGRYLSFTDWDSGDLALRDLRDGTSRRLTNKGSWAWDDFADRSIVSPDGRQVAYAWFDGKTGRTDLRLLSLGEQAGSPRIVHRSDETFYIAPAAWTPDGKSVLVIRTLGDRTNQIAIISVADGSARALKSLDWRWPSIVSLSPDGRYIAYDVPAADDVPARDIVVLAADGSREVVVVQHPANDHSPLWSPDGSHIVFLSDRTGNASLWMAPVDAGRPTGPATLIKRDVGQFSPLGITQGGALYYVAGGGRKNVYVAQLDGQMKVVSPPALATERFINSNGSPAWSPDGQYLAYLSQRRLDDSPGSLVLVVRSLKTGEDREIPTQVRLRPPVVRWFPDGRSVLVASRDLQKSRFVYYRVDIGSGNAEVLHYTKSRVRNGNLADLSQDGNSIFYVDSDVGSKTEQLMRFDIDSRRETVLRSLPGIQICSLALSADGAQLAYLATNLPIAQGPSVLEVMPAAGDEPRVVFRVKTWGGGRFNGLAWTPDNRYVLFVRPENGESQTQAPTLWRIPVAGGEPEHMGISLNMPAHPHLHPDGHRIAFQLDEPGTSEVWALENFLPTTRAAR